MDEKYRPMDMAKAQWILTEVTRNFPVTLAFGTLLGIYRDKDLIAHDWDLDFSCLAEDLSKFNIKSIESLGFERFRDKADLPVWKTETEESEELLVRTISFEKWGIRVDIDPVYKSVDGVHGLVLKGRKREKFVAQFDYDWFKNPCEITDKNGAIFLAPGNIEEYLRLNYDGWRHPAKEHRSWNRRECRKDCYEIQI